MLHKMKEQTELVGESMLALVKSAAPRTGHPDGTAQLVDDVA